MGQKQAQAHATSFCGKKWFADLFSYFKGNKPDADHLAAVLDAELFPSLHTLLRTSDFVSLHVPGGAATANLIERIG